MSLAEHENAGNAGNAGRAATAATTSAPAPATTSPRAAAVADLVPRLRAILGEDGLLTDHSQRRTYESDGLTHHREVPGVVALPTSADQVAAVVRLCHEHGVPFVPRGAGTGLSAGALPHAEGVLLVTSRMRRILEIDIANECAVVEPGVANLDITRAAAPHGYYYAPDPSSQQVCSVGGNVAENSGGAHCLKYGFTVNHVRYRRGNLPEDSVSVEIDGMNHAQFGDYGPQTADGTPRLGDDEARAELADTTAEFLGNG